MPERLVAGRRVAWREAGEGAPALLIHCALAHSSAFAGMMAALGDRLAMRAVDLPGHGGTEADLSRGMQAQAVGQAAALIEGGPAHVIGHSFGATVALRLALERPDLVRRLVLIEPVMFGFLADAGHPAYAAEAGREAAIRAAEARGDLAGAAAAFLERWGAGPPSPYMIARMPLVAASHADLFDDPGRRLRLRDLDGLAPPVLLIEGAGSPPEIAAIHDAMMNRLPSARRVAIAGAGHMAPVTHPAAVSGAVRAFLGEDR